MPAGHLSLGRAGEDAAVSLLTGQGYRVLVRNWRCKLGEVDIICAKSDLIVFVEVKTRGENSLASGAEAVDKRKRAKIVAAASEYLSGNGLWHRPCRFDVVSISRQGDELRTEHLPDAFSADSGSGKGWQPW